MNFRLFADKLNQWGRDKVPFLFVIDFEMQRPMAFPLDTIDSERILFNINGFTNSGSDAIDNVLLNKEVIQKHAISFNDYQDKFNIVQKHLDYGDSFLTNLTISTEVKLYYDLKKLFTLSHAKYKLWYDNDFLVFSPEIFIQIRNGKIYSYPMKGTIDASVSDARGKILSDRKELAEHVTIVDLIRNDLSLVADHIEVSRFRYIEELRTHDKTLLQVSSEITGQLSPDYASHLGDILLNLLPAGSVSGAPKPKTLDVIREAEKVDRGFYTGVLGYFDGQNLDSGVMIRFIERDGERYFYRSGGGITTQSNARSEYEEVISKVYVPVT